MYKSKFRLLLLLGMAGLVACSSGSGSSTGSSTSSNTVSTQQLQSINNIPSINMSNLDIASTTSSSVNALKFQSTETTSSDISRAGCELRACVSELSYQIQEFNQNICIMKALEQNADDFSVGIGEYNYYSVEFSSDFFSEVDTDGSGASAQVSGGLSTYTERIRVGVIDTDADGEVDQLQLMLCNDEGGSFSQHMALIMGVEDGAFTGSITNIFSNPFDANESDAFQITAVLPATDDPGEFNDGDQVIIDALFNGFWGSGSIYYDVQKVNGSNLATVDAEFKSGSEDSQWGSWTSQVYGIFDSTEGCSLFSSTGSYPAEVVGQVFTDSQDLTDIQSTLGLSSTDNFCWKEPENSESSTSITDFIQAANSEGNCTFEDGASGDDLSNFIECFTFSTSGGGLQSYVIDPASEGSYFSTVSNAAALDTFEAPEITFGTNAWDCEATDSSFVTINPTVIASAFESCFDIQQGSRSISSCREQDIESGAEEQFDGDFGGTEQTIGGNDSEDDGSEDNNGEGPQQNSVLGAECNSDSQCTDLPDGRCLVANPMWFCTIPCTQDSDCTVHRNDFSCQNSRCRPAS